MSTKLGDFTDTQLKTVADVRAKKNTNQSKTKSSMVGGSKQRELANPKKSFGRILGTPALIFSVESFLYG